MKKVLLLSTLFVSLLTANDIFLHKFFNDKECDQVLNNGGYFKTCYSYKMKGAKYVTYTLDGDLVYKKNIKERPRFYTDRNIPKRYASTYSDYTRNSYSMDRGHLKNDASSDYSNRSLRATYTMSNIIPQHKILNRGEEYWLGLEKQVRRAAKKYGSVTVLNGVEYSSNPKRIGRDKIAIPSAFWKMYYDKKRSVKRCYYFENKAPANDSILEDFEVDCNELI